MSNKKVSYSAAGVDYGSIDPVKVSAQSAAAQTAGNLKHFGLQEVAASRGESAYVWDEGEAYRALVVEGLGTKNLVADAMRHVTEKTYYDQIAQDTVAMIVNDLIVVGALPNVINAYFAIGDSAWMNDTRRSTDLIKGWQKACNLAGAVWGGGETPALKGIINPDTIDLAGSAIGSVFPKERLVLGDKLQAGDEIILVESSGIHANGLSLARRVSEILPEGYATKMSDGKMFGEALLAPTPIYVGFVKSLLEAQVEIHYMANITGHGWRKLMRADRDFTYRLTKIPKPQTEFLFIQEKANLSDAEMYDSFNMGAGFAVYVPKNEAKKVVELAKKSGFRAWPAGIVEKGSKKVIIDPLNITFDSKTLMLRTEAKPKPKKA